jgi:oligoendopeptidase F
MKQSTNNKPKDSWDLSPLYKNIESWEKDFNKIDNLLKDFNAYKNKLSNNPQTLAEAYKKSDKLGRLLEKIYTYAHLKSDLDIGNSKNMAILNRIRSKYAQISGSTAWFEPEILSIPEDKLKEYLNSNELKFYQRSLNEIIRQKKHMLSAPEEKLLGLASDALATPEKAFSALNNVDIKFPEVSDETGNKIQLTHSLYTKLLENTNREIRKEAFNGMYDTFEKYKNTLSVTLEGNTKKHVFSSEIRNFDSALQSSLHNDNVPVKVYESLISAVHNNLDAFKDYLKLRSKILKIDDLNMYDLHCPLIQEKNVDISWEEACNMVGNAVKVLGEEYAEISETAFKNRWIDVYERPGKRSGAYSSGCFDSPPYILMNYNGTLNDVFTLAHELGHSMHSYYSNKTQEYHYADYKIFVAEVASITNELILHDYLMKTSNDKSFKLNLLNHLANEIRGTVYRQTMFAEFEKNIHEDLEKGIPLTAESLSEKYYNLNALYHPGIETPDKKIAIEWARIPHFYYNFYVYKYATGFSAAATLAKGIIAKDKNKTDAYLNFLKAGSTKDVLDILKAAGVDLNTPEPVNNALNLFRQTVNKIKSNF